MKCIQRSSDTIQPGFDKIFSLNICIISSISAAKEPNSHRILLPFEIKMKNEKINLKTQFNIHYEQPNEINKHFHPMRRGVVLCRNVIDS